MSVDDPIADQEERIDACTWLRGPRTQSDAIPTLAAGAHSNDPLILRCTTKTLRSALSYLDLGRLSVSVLDQAIGMSKPVDTETQCELLVSRRFIFFCSAEMPHGEALPARRRPATYICSTTP